MLTRTFADDSGAYEMNFASDDESAAYEAPAGRTEVENRPSLDQVWRDRAWVQRPLAPTIVSKDAIWRRATDKEAEQMEAALQSQPVRIRRIYEGATFISSDDELFSMLEAALVRLFGADRAAELLEPTG